MLPHNHAQIHVHNYAITNTLYTHTHKCCMCIHSMTVLHINRILMLLLYKQTTDQFRGWKTRLLARQQTTGGETNVKRKIILLDDQEIFMGGRWVHLCGLGQCVENWACNKTTQSTASLHKKKKHALVTVKTEAIKQSRKCGTLFSGPWVGEIGVAGRSEQCVWSGSSSWIIQQLYSKVYIYTNIC